MRSGKTMTSVKNLSMTKSQILEDDPLAGKRWNVEKKRIAFETDLNQFHERQLNRCEMIRNTSNSAAIDIYKKLLFKIRWAYPPLSSVNEKHVFDYCDHLLYSKTPQAPFKGAQLLQAWAEKSKGEDSEKISRDVYNMVTLIKNKILRRDRGVKLVSDHTEAKTEALIIKKENTLRWTMETNNSRRDRYWTIWYLVNNVHIPELKRYLINLALHSNFTVTQKETGEYLVCEGIDERDPDFGYTALHYACKIGNVEMIRLLLSYGADIKAKITDGRSPLHLAAAYGGREAVVELLGSGADPEYRDDYGCTAKDLAEQNTNEQTYTALNNWDNLLPPEEEEEPEEEEDLSSIPEEYLKTPPEILGRMSPILQLLTRRLDGDGKHSFGKTMDPIVELRLCDKHAKSCMHEGFRYEGYKSYRRKWRVVKNLFSINDDETELPNELNQNIVESNNNISLPQDNVSITISNEDNNSRNNNQHHLSNEVSNIINEMQSGLSLDNNISFKTSTDNNALNSLICASKTNPDLMNSNTNINNSKQVLNSTAAADIAREFAEILIADQKEGFASIVLKECLRIPNLSYSSRISIMARYCETLLCLHDLILLFKDDKEIGIGSGLDNNARIRVLPPRRSDLDKEAKLKTSLVAGLTVDKTAMTTIKSSSSSIYKSRLNVITSECLFILQEATFLHNEMYWNAIVEPCTLSPLLELLAEVAERQENVIQAYNVMIHAHCVSRRSLGAAHEETIRIALQVLRLQMKCATKEGLKSASAFAVEMSRELDILSKNDQKGADRLSQSCAELISLSRLLEDTATITKKIPKINKTNKNISNKQEKFEISNEIKDDDYYDTSFISVSAGQLLGQSVTHNVENSRIERFQKLQKFKQSDGPSFYRDVATGVSSSISQGNIGNTIDSNNLVVNENNTNNVTCNFFISMGLKDRYKHLRKQLSHQKKLNSSLISNKYKDNSNLDSTTILNYNDVHDIDDVKSNISIDELIVDKNILQYNQDMIDVQSVESEDILVNNDIINIDDVAEEDDDEEEIVWKGFV